LGHSPISHPITLNFDVLTHSHSIGRTAAICQLMKARAFITLSANIAVYCL